MSAARLGFAFLANARQLLRDVNPHFVISRKMPIFAVEMARQCTDMDDALRLINQRLRKLEESDSEKTEEIGRLNRIIGQKDVEIHSLKMELSSTKSELAEAQARIERLEDDDDDDSSGSSGKPEKNSSNSSVPRRRKASWPVSFAGRSRCASRVEGQAVDSPGIREPPCSLSVHRTES